MVSLWYLALNVTHPLDLGDFIQTRNHCYCCLVVALRDWPSVSFCVAATVTIPPNANIPLSRQSMTLQSGSVGTSTRRRTAREGMKWTLSACPDGPRSVYRSGQVVIPAGTPYTHKCVSFGHHIGFPRDDTSDFIAETWAGTRSGRR